MYSYRLKRGFTLDTSESYRVAKDGTECAYLWKTDYYPKDATISKEKIGWLPASENYDWTRTNVVRYDPQLNKIYHCDEAGYMSDGIPAELDNLLVKDTSTPRQQPVAYDLETLPGTPHWSDNGQALYTPTGEKVTTPYGGSYPTMYPTKKETMLENIIATNKTAATQAAYLEAGRLANATVQNILFKKFPNLPQTPFNALVVANLADVIGKQIKPSPKLQKITTAMVTQAYAEVYQLIDLEGMIGELLNTVGDQFDNAE
ncbi:MAG: hypothetical protein BWY21_00018 [Parcubacteria group bacterium ADurb.Bin216]|nr:MAG: hypothetical protein BWY21_00018 [Parcubacteria group bacterium ADurb.Bin216]